MLTYLYPIGFFASLLGLILWFYYQDKPQRSRQMSQLFLGGFFVYLFALAFADGALSNKLLVLFRDLVILGLVSQFFNFFRKNKVLFVAMMIILFGAFKFFGFEMMMKSFPVDEAVGVTENEIQLDPAGELLIEVADNEEIASLAPIFERYNLTYSRAFYPLHGDQTDLDDYYVVDIPDKFLKELSGIEQELINSSLVDWVEENEIIKLDPLEGEVPKRLPGNYGLNDPAVGELWGFEKMKIEELYALLKEKDLKPAQKALIVILDTGIDAGHEDLALNYKSVNKKYDSDPQSHGTHCAGIAAAVSNNGKGVASFSQDNAYIQIGSVRVLGAHGGGTQAGIIKGMLEAADHGADVISMSLGGRSTKARQRAYARAVNYCNRQGAVVVVAAGNSQMDASAYSPANTPGVIAVAAVDADLNKATFSNHVTNLKMGIAAPGVGIYSTVPGNKYAAYNGTSMATPYVAGLVGLMKSINPQLTTQQIHAILENTGIETDQTEATGRFIYPAAAIRALLE